MVEAPLLARMSTVVRHAESTAHGSRAERATSSKKSAVGDPGAAVLDLWLFFNIGPSHFLLPLLCISLLLQRARRNLLLVNVAITWCICGFASSVLYVLLAIGNVVVAAPNPASCSVPDSRLALTQSLRGQANWS